MHFLKISSILTFSSTVFATQCYNHIKGVQKSGGLWVDEGALLNISFCKWEAESKRVRYDSLDARPEAKRVAWDGLIDVSESKRVRSKVPRVRYEGLRDAKRVAWDGLEKASGSRGPKQTKPTAPRVSI
ncbi:uncharacterized protein EAE97_001279 [Botrytis byssoidea]|uniref:Uncharacterized protein n=1 Tax=Botrytis byssoidea TaxID=139641 RepID=A0A9P5IZL4_9HELO|nr:uncharacterized protein EAE97_001279 [Botrytis byssoidea]KAF7953880.1 hypothetical protein EAE97_001279 [Botrytis byssoidea]